MASQKRASDWIVPLLITIAILFGIRFYQDNKPAVHSPFNYTFAYSKDGKLYAYDLKTGKHTKTKLEVGEPVGLQWSVENKLAIKDAKGNLYITKNFEGFAHPEEHITQSENFFWNKVGTGVYYTTFFGVNPKDNHGPKYFFATDVDGAKEVGKESYDKAFGQLYRDRGVEEKASFDGNYIGKATYFKDQDDKLTLIYAPIHKEYPLPDGSWKPRLSQNNTYIALKDNAAGANHGGIAIYVVKDVLNRDFSKPVFQNDNIYDYEWIDGERLVYVVQKIEQTRSVSKLAATYDYNIYNVKTGQTEYLFSVKKLQHQFADIHVSPDEERLVYIGEDKDGRNELDEFGLKDKKMLTQTSFDSGAWANPLRQN